MCTVTVIPEHAMSGEDEDTSMLLYRASGYDLASKEIALKVGEMVILRVFGEEDYRTQIPLSVEEQKDRWIIRGTRNAEEHPEAPGVARRGAVELSILKRNCQIIKLIEKGSFPTLP